MMTPLYARPPIDLHEEWRPPVYVPVVYAPGSAAMPPALRRKDARFAAMATPPWAHDRAPIEFDGMVFGDDEDELFGDLDDWLGDDGGEYGLGSANYAYGAKGKKSRDPNKPRARPFKAISEFFTRRDDQGRTPAQKAARLVTAVEQGEVANIRQLRQLLQRQQQAPPPRGPSWGQVAGGAAVVGVMLGAGYWLGTR